MYKNGFLTVFLLICCCLPVFSIDTLMIGDNVNGKLDIYPFVYTFEDTTNNLTIKELLDTQDIFSKTKSIDNLSFGLNKNNCWVKFSIKNVSAQKASFILVISNPDLNYLDFFEFKGTTMTNSVHTGELRESNSRPIPHRFFLFKLELLPNTGYTYFIRSNNNGDTNLVPISLQKEQVFYKNELRDNFFYAILYGILFFIIWFNLYLFRIDKDKIYLYYFNYILFFTIFLTGTDGYIYFLRWTWLSNMSKILLPSISIAFFITFSQKFLESPIKWPFLNKILNVIKVILVLLGILPIVNFSFFVAPAVLGITLLFCISFIVFIIYAFKSYNKNYLPSQYFLFAFLIMVVFSTVHPLKEIGILPYNFFTINSARFGFTIESVFLTLAVLERFRIEQENAKIAIEKSHKRIEIQNKELEVINTELEKLSIVASETDNSVAIYDKKGSIEWCNEGFERFYETSVAKLIKKKKDYIENIIPLKDIKELLNRCITNIEPIVFECKLEFDTLRYKWMQTTLSPYLKNKRVQKIIAVGSDISNLKEYEAKLKVAKEKAEESDRLKTIFLGNMSHEVRTPLNGILGFSELLVSKDLPSDKREKFVKIIKSNGEQLIRIIDDILDMSLIETDQLKIKESNFSLIKFCDEIVDFFEFYKSSVDKPQIDLLTDLSINAEKDHVISDKYRLKQVLMNLLKNGFKFTEEGYVKLGCYTDEKNILFFVEDTGIGIDPSKIEDVFSRFRQGDESTARKYGGNGLGLTISKGIVEVLGGKIWIEPKYTDGFRICFTIPLKQKNFSENNGEKGKIENKNVLIVEDHDGSYEYLLEILEPYGFIVSRAVDGHQAVELSKENGYNLVLMDINLPKLDGISATREIRKFNTDVPIIAQTAYITKYKTDNILASGCNDVITKPINPSSLLKKMESLLQEIHG